MGTSLELMVANWQCPDCHYWQDWSYADLANRGEPICPNCDSEMEAVPETGRVLLGHSTRGVA